MNALVTGASGFVGHHLVRRLLDEGYSVITTGHNADSPFDESIKYVCIDLTKDLEPTLNFNGVDAVFHLAGLAAVGPSFSSPRKYIETNTSIQINLFEACLKQDAAPRFIVVSSGSLYDTNAPLPLTETSPTSPSSPYAVSKMAQETLAQYYGTRGFEIIIARPFNHIGPGQTPGFLVPDLIAKLQEAIKTSSKKIATGNLDTKRDYTDVRDIVKAYVLLSQNGRAGEIYNICSGRAVNGSQILDTLMKLINYRIETETDPTLIRPTDVAERYGSYAKLKSDTGWEPEISLENTLRDILA